MRLSCMPPFSMKRGAKISEEARIYRGGNGLSFANGNAGTLVGGDCRYDGWH